MGGGGVYNVRFSDKFSLSKTILKLVLAQFVNYGLTLLQYCAMFYPHINFRPPLHPAYLFIRHSPVSTFLSWTVKCTFFFFIFSEKKNCSNTDTWYSSKVTSLSLFVDMCHPLNVNIIFFVIKIIRHCFMILVAICRIWIRKLLAYYTMKLDLH